MLVGALHNHAVVGVAALIFACIPLTVGYGPALICIGVSLAFIVVICLSARSINRAASQVSGFAQPDARSSSGASLRFGSPTICIPDDEDEDEIESEFFNIANLRRSVAACFTNIKPRRARYPSEASTASLQDTTSPSESSISVDDGSTRRASDDSKPLTVSPVSNRPRAKTFPAPPRDRAPSFSGFAFPPHEPESGLELEPTTPDVFERKPSRPKLAVRIPSTLRLGTLKSATKPSPSPVISSPCARSTSAKAHPFRRYLRSLRGMSARSKREGSTTMDAFDDLDLGPLQRSTSVKGGSTSSSHDMCADFMVRCITVAAT
ncbi:unnamed protein product [Peniophora sp. CBMAI 1063]|nr:unnamed protein product [Peniophora sp. CBMAI 1063]